MPYKDPEQQREYQRQWVAQRRAEALEGKSCVDCGATTRLEFDHRNRDEKLDHRIWSWSKSRREAELTKCDIRCADCHRLRHGAGKYTHGSSGYQRGKCRCEVCCAWKAASNARYRDRGADPSRTGVYGFAGRRVATPPPRQDGEHYPEAA